MRRLISIIFLSIISYLFASQIILGLSRKNLHIWRYWSKNNDQWHEELLVFNAFDTSKTLFIDIVKIVDNGLSVSLTKDSVVNKAKYSYTINPFSFLIIQFPYKSYYNVSDYLLHFYLSGNEIGFMRLYRKRPPKEIKSHIVTTIDSIANDNYIIWLEQEARIYKESSLIKVRYNIRNKTFTRSRFVNKIIIEIKDPSGEDQEQINKKIAIKNINNNSLIQHIEKYPGDKRKFFAMQIPENKLLDTHYIEIILNTKRTGKSRVEYLNTWYDVGKNRHKLSLPLFISKE